MDTPVTRAVPPTGVRRLTASPRRRADLPHRRPRLSLPPIA